MFSHLKNKITITFHSSDILLYFRKPLILLIIFERKICVIAGTRTTDLQFSALAP